MAINKKLLILFFVLFLLVGCQSAIEEKVCNQDLSKAIENYDYFYFNESTESMYPTINKTSIAYFEKVTENTKLEKGDIVGFKVPAWLGCLRVHRIVDIREDKKGIYYVTKGDNNMFSEFWQKTRRGDIYYKITKII